MCITLLALAFFVGGRSIVESSAFYQDAFASYLRISRESHLYVYEETEDHLVTITDYASVKYQDKMDEQIAFIEGRLTAYYAEDPIGIFDGKGLEKYYAQKVGDKAFTQKDGKPYFAWSGESGAPAPIVDAKTLRPFYDEAILAAVGYLGDCEEYAKANQTLARTYNVYIIPISISLSFLVFEFLVPLIFFRRGYCTIGMKSFKLALLTSEAISPKFPRFLARFSWMLIVEVLASMMTFGVPLFVNIGMAILRKDGQALHDYMTGTYLVDASDQSVFLSKAEYLEMQAKAEATQARPYLSTWKGDRPESMIGPASPKADTSSIEENDENTYNESYEEKQEFSQDGNTH